MDVWIFENLLKILNKLVIKKFEECLKHQQVDCSARRQATERTCSLKTELWVFDLTSTSAQASKTDVNCNVLDKLNVTNMLEQYTMQLIMYRT